MMKASTTPNETRPENAYDRTPCWVLLDIARTWVRRRPVIWPSAIHAGRHQGHAVVELPAQQRHPRGADEDAAPHPDRRDGRQLEGIHGPSLAWRRPAGR